MSNIAASMPKRPDDKSAQAHLSQRDYAALKQLADEKKWSVKKYLEDLIDQHLRLKKKKK